MSENEFFKWERERVDDLDEAEMILRDVFDEDERSVELFQWALDKTRHYKGHDYYTVSGNILYSREWNEEVGEFDIEIMIGEYGTDKKVSQGNWIDKYSVGVTKSLHLADMGSIEKIPGVRLAEFEGSPTYFFYIAEEMMPVIEKVVDEYASDEVVLTRKTLDEEIEKEKLECLLRCVHEKGWKHVLDVLYDVEGVCDE